MLVNKNCKDLDLVHDNFNYNTFNINDEEFNKLSNDTKYKHLQNLFSKINKLRKVKSRTEDTQKIKRNQTNTMSFVSA